MFLREFHVPYLGNIQVRRRVERQSAVADIRAKSFVRQVFDNAFHRNAQRYAYAAAPFVGRNPPAT